MDIVHLPEGAVTSAWAAKVHVWQILYEGEWEGVLYPALLRWPERCNEITFVCQADGWRRDRQTDMLITDRQTEGQENEEADRQTRWWQTDRQTDSHETDTWTLLSLMGNLALHLLNCNSNTAKDFIILQHNILKRQWATKLPHTEREIELES